MRNVQGSKNQTLFLGDTGPGESETLFGISAGNENEEIALDLRGNKQLGIGKSPGRALDVAGGIRASGTSLINGSTLRIAHASSGLNNALHVNSDNVDTNIWRVSSGAYKNNSQYGFSLQYEGSKSGNDNNLRLLADDTTGTQQTAFAVKQDGSIGFGDQLQPTAQVDINGDLRVRSQADIDGLLALDSWIDVKGTGNISSSSPSATTNVGWKVGLWGEDYWLGVGGSQVAYQSGDTHEFYTGATNPADDATAPSADSNATFAVLDNHLYLRTGNSSQSGTAYNSSSVLRIENSGNAFIEMNTESGAYQGIGFTDNTSLAGGVAYGHNDTSDGNQLLLSAWDRISFHVGGSNGITGQKPEVAYIDGNGSINADGGITANGTVDFSNANSVILPTV
jgi:hypothetical protein